jgi:hypothetical protein
MPFFGPEARLNRARQVFVDMHGGHHAQSAPTIVATRPALPTPLGGGRGTSTPSASLYLTPHTSMSLPLAPSRALLALTLASTPSAMDVSTARYRCCADTSARTHLSLKPPIASPCPNPSFARVLLLSLAPENGLRWRVTGLDRWWCLPRLATAWTRPSVA